MAVIELEPKRPEQRDRQVNEHAPSKQSQSRCHEKTAGDIREVPLPVKAVSLQRGLAGVPNHGGGSDDEKDNADGDHG